MELIKPSNMILPRVNAVFTTKTDNDLTDYISSEFHISKDRIYMPVQKHTSNVHVLEHDLAPVIADAVLTQEKDIVIGVKVADCVPVLVYDPKQGVVGAVHAGWRGTAAEILIKALTEMKKTFSSSMDNVLVSIGPSIRKCCYEVDRDVCDAVYKHCSVCDDIRDGKYFIDLSDVNKQQALSMGVLPDNIWQSEECTFCNPERFYSYRYNRGTKERQGGFIQLL